MRGEKNNNILKRQKLQRKFTKLARYINLTDCKLKFDNNSSIKPPVKLENA